MAKSKRGPSLFEMLDGAEGVRKPSAASRTRQARMSRERQRVEQESPRADSGVAGPSSQESAEPLMEFDGDRLRFSFSSVSAAIVIFLAVACMAGVYFLGTAYGKKVGRRQGYEAGRASYAGDVADEIAAARRREPASQLVNQLEDGAVNASEDEAAAAESTDSTSDDGAAANPWVQGLTYIVVQEFTPGNLAHVEPAQRFLAEHGIETEAVTLESGGVQLITKQGYNRRDATQRRLADKLKEQIHATGRDYYASGGGYRLEGYFRTLKRDHW